MRGVIGSEVLRSVSGLSALAVYLVALLIPVEVLVSDGSRFDLGGLDAATATVQLLQPLAWSAVAAAFVGAYAVTREYYYGSMDRTLTAVGFRRAFAGKMVSGALSAMVLSVGLSALWTTMVFLLLRQEGLPLALSADAWRIYGGAAAGAMLGALLGEAVGWISRNYYLAAGIVLLYPIAIELAMLRSVPDLARFSPGLALAALAAPGYEGALLEFLPALGVALAWTIALVALAWVRGRRRTA